jgi:hypothetical protein
MNKAFVREPDDDGRQLCPRCGSSGVPVGAAALDTHIRPASRPKMLHDAWFCSFPRCNVAYFNQFDAIVTTDELLRPVYPKEPDAPICACFGLTYDDVAADLAEGAPTRVRQLLERAKSSEARCEALAADGRSCIGAVQELYMKLRSAIQSTARE